MKFKNVLKQMKNFKDDSVLRGVSIGMVGGCIAVLLIQTICYCIMGSCAKCAKKLRIRRKQTDVPTDVVIDIEKDNEIEQASDETETTVPEAKETGTEEAKE
ncbi:uncharacterized protein LOC114531767 [Dendronephthya gigantea]|uniref:uncharacterized protein LOC114531767 n=1 Tax=Dendronephthya gigantea TaxID=151771 RepID=UPI00106B5DBF|nr:uncharacterized protein LOC114531767 [Dendronephthya gigantea]